MFFIYVIGGGSDVAKMFGKSGNKADRGLSGKDAQ